MERFEEQVCNSFSAIPIPLSRTIKREARGPLHAISIGIPVRQVLISRCETRLLTHCSSPKNIHRPFTLGLQMHRDFTAGAAGFVGRSVRDCRTIGADRHRLIPKPTARGSAKHRGDERSGSTAGRLPACLLDFVRPIRGESPSIQTHQLPDELKRQRPSAGVRLSCAAIDMNRRALTASELRYKSAHVSAFAATAVPILRESESRTHMYDRRRMMRA